MNNRPLQVLKILAYMSLVLNFLGAIIADIWLTNPSTPVLPPDSGTLGHYKRLDVYDRG
jgi:hypothetical protein